MADAYKYVWVESDTGRIIHGEEREFALPVAFEQDEVEEGLAEYLTGDFANETPGGSEESLRAVKDLGMDDFMLCALVPITGDKAKLCFEQAHAAAVELLTEELDDENLEHYNPDSKVHQPGFRSGDLREDNHAPSVETLREEESQKAGETWTS